MLRIAIWDDEIQKPEEAVVWDFNALIKSCTEIMFEVQWRKNEETNPNKKEGQKKQKTYSI